MSLQPDGGPAFPDGARKYSDDYEPGMTLRDWFAGKALEAIVSNETRVRVIISETNDAAEAVDLAVALAAYGIADAMLAARERKEDA